MTTYRKNQLLLDEMSLRHNVRALRALAGSPFCPMVKASAYGLGAVEVTRLLRSEGTRAVGVALIEEALELRASGDIGEIWHFGYFRDQWSAEAAVQAQLIPVIGSVESLELWCQAVEHIKPPSGSVILDLNTGMNRLGLEAGDETELRATAKLVSRLARALGQPIPTVLSSAMTHFIEGGDDRLSDHQVILFEAGVRSLEKWLQCPIHRTHTANSARLAASKKLSQKRETHAPRSSGARPGIALYGGLSLEELKLLELKPVVSWVSELAQVRRVKAHQSISYGATWAASRDSVIGVVACGYADGYRRGMRQAEVIVAETRVPVVGTICMDYFMIDLTDLSADAVAGLCVGAPVHLIGRSIQVNDLAQWSGTISYEILTGISNRVKRQWVRSGAML